MKCNKCGSENAADSKFCYNCGAPLEADVQSAAQADPYTRCDRLLLQSLKSKKR